MVVVIIAAVTMAMVVTDLVVIAMVGVVRRGDSNDNGDALNISGNDGGNGSGRDVSVEGEC